MDSDKFGGICRLCLSTIDTQLDNNLQKFGIQMLELCLPEVDRTTCYDCALCPSCIYCLKEIYFFKMKCLQTEEKLRLYLENCDTQKISLRQVMECVSNLQNENAEICRSCLSLSQDFVSVEEDDLNCDLVLKNMFTTCLPEIDFNLSNNPVICNKCVEWLRQFYSFKSKCLLTEEQIFMFKRDLNVRIVNLPDLIKSQNQEQVDFEYVNLDCKVKLDLAYTSVEENEESKLCSGKEVKMENLDSPIEGVCLQGNVDIENLKPEIELTEGVKIQFVNCGNIGIKEEFPNGVSQNTKDDPNFPVRLKVLSQKPEILKWYTCETCSYQTKWRHHLERHKQIHEDESKHQKSFKCLKCGFVSNYKHALLKHSTLEHGDWFKCVECEYKTKWKRCFNEHVVRHTNGLMWHHCELCSYKTKWKYHLKRHMVTHQ